MVNAQVQHLQSEILTGRIFGSESSDLLPFFPFFPFPPLAPPPAFFSLPLPLSPTCVKIDVCVEKREIAYWKLASPCLFLALDIYGM